MFIFERERQTECKWARGRERGRHRIWSRLQDLSCHTEPDAGLELMNCEIMTWAEVGRLTNWATQAPLFLSFFLNLQVNLMCPFWEDLLSHSILFYSFIRRYFRGTWVAQSVKHPTSAQVMISQSMSSSPASGSVLTAQSLEPVSDSVSPSLWPSPVHALSLPVSKINKR